MSVHLVMMHLLFLGTVSVFSVVRGVVEGMIMTQYGDAMHDYGVLCEGVRGHRWTELYHVLSVVRSTLGFFIGALLFYLVTISQQEHCLSLLIPLVALSSSCGWLAFESAYNFARYADSPPPENENFLGLNLYIKRDTADMIRWMTLAVLLVAYAAAAFWRLG